MANNEWLYREASDIAAAIRRGECSASQLLDSQLAVIAERDPIYQTYITLTDELARQQAAQIDQSVADGRDPGPLAGVPIAIKDIFDVTGTPTTAAMAIHQNSIAERDATVVRRLHEAGAVLLGKVTLTEGVYAEHRAPFPIPVNPHHQDYWPGASSSGSAIAVVAGLCCGALGSETGGSIKLPAAANGVTALKPTWGRVSRHGVFELAATLDHIGPFCRSVRDIAAFMQTIAGPDIDDPTAAQAPVPNYTEKLHAGAKDLRIGIDPKWIESCVDVETAAALDDAVEVLKQCGATVVEVSVPDVTDMIWDWFTVCAAQTTLAHRETFPSERDRYGPALTQLLDMGLTLSATDYQEVLLRRESFRGEVNALFTTIDALALPVLAFPVPTIARMADVDDDLIAGLHRFTCPFNLSGHPGLVLPCGINREGLPLVFQLVGAHFAEDVLLRAGADYQKETAWHHLPVTK